MVTLTTTSPLTSACLFQLLRILSFISARYAGQQKSPTSTVPLTPVPPPVDSPNPCPRAPVTATAGPDLSSSPRASVVPRASGVSATASDLGGAFAAFTGDFSIGTVISGAAGAGARTASGFGDG